MTAPTLIFLRLNAIRATPQAFRNVLPLTDALTALQLLPRRSENFPQTTITIGHAVQTRRPTRRLIDHHVAAVLPSVQMRAPGVKVGMAESIGDWYAGKSGRSPDYVGHDWENDDLLEYTPDSWLDDLRTGAPPARFAAPPESRRSSSTVGRSSSSPARSSSVRSSPARPSPARSPSARSVPAPQPRPGRDLTEAALAVQTAVPGIGYKKLARRLRQNGWPTITEADLRGALEQPPTSPPPGQRTTGPSTTRSVPPQPPAASKETELALAIRVIRKTTPGLTLEQLTEQVRRCGWPDATRAGMRVAVEELRETSRSNASTPLTQGRLSHDLMIVAVRALHAMAPHADAADLTRLLRQYGWHLTPPEQVRVALAKVRPRKSANRAKPQPSTKRAEKPRTPAPAQRRTRPGNPDHYRRDVTPLPKAEVCPSCGSAVSVLGTCHCS
jgi:hypothetical protein